jgi:sodium-dependent phosphate cotransporter
MFHQKIARYRLVRVFRLLAALYAFFVAISLLSASFEFLGEDFSRRLLSMTENPFLGLFIGILATSILQSSSTVTSMTVALVAGGGLDVARAIPIIMGSNMGTSVTNVIVAAGHINRPKEFKRAFAAAVVDDFFEILSILILFPLQLTTNFLGVGAGFLSQSLAHLGGLAWTNPLRAIVDPAVQLLTNAVSQSGPVLLAISLILLVLALHYLVVDLKVLVIGRVEAFVDKRLFKTACRAMLLGFVCTVFVQSSSVTTSLVVPLAGIAILKLRQVFPYVLGANTGTTTTAIFAALVTGEEVALTVAFAHLLYNVVGIVVIWPIRKIPMYLAEWLAEKSAESKLVPLLYVGVVFFAIPITLIYLAR